MLRLSDSRNFSRTLAAIGLIAGPVLLAIGGLLDPAWDDDAATYLQNVVDDKGMYIAAGALGTVGTLLFIPGMLGVRKLMRRRGISLGQAAATLLTFGLIGLVPVLAFNGFDVILAEAENREAAVAIYDDVEESAAVTIYWVSFFFVGIVLGSILLTIALFRRRIVPIWSPILLIVSIVVGFFGQSRVVSAISFLVLAAALYPLAMRIWGLRDEQWERWVPLEDGEAAPPASAPPAERPGEPVGV
jgi:hypothetical protein